MKNSMVLATSWITSDPRRMRMAIIAFAGIAAVLGLHETAFAGSATGDIH